MTNRIMAFVLGAAVLAAAASAQDSQLPVPSPVEKQLAACASNVDEVTLSKNMLALASEVMNTNGDGKDEAAIHHLIEGLDGIYVREYDFDKEAQYSMEEIEQLRKYYETSEWSPVVRERDRKTGESTDIMVKLVNGKSRGMFILDVEPREVDIVLILGPVSMEDLGTLKGLAFLGMMSGTHHTGPDNARKKDGDQ
jgi:hypothetical protein